MRTYVVHELQALPTCHHAAHRVARVALLHAYEKLCWHVHGKSRLVEERGAVVVLSRCPGAVLCSNDVAHGGDSELGERGGVALRHDGGVVGVRARQIARGRPHPCWPVQIRSERVQGVHGLGALSDA